MNFSRIGPESPQRYQIYRLHEGDTQLLTAIEREVFNIHHIQPLGDGQLLLECARRLYQDAGAGRSGRHYDCHGHLLGSVTWGDGITELALTPDGLI